MGKIAFVFSGQGAQYSGMGKALYEASAAAREVFLSAEKIKPGITKLCFEADLEELSITKNTQPALFCVDLAAARALEEAGVKPDMAAGFSLGETAALTYAGIMRFDAGFSFVCKRGEAMQAAAEKNPGAMAAVLKLGNEQVEEICGTFSHMHPVNYNCPGQLVVAGDKNEMPAFVEKITAAGGKAVLLNVSGGFHSPFMQPAADTLSEYLRDVQVAEPNLPVYANYNAQPYAGDLKDLMIKQITNPVRWQATIEDMAQNGVDTFIEVGAGKTLCGLIKKTIKGVCIFNVQDADSLLKTTGEVQG